MQINDNSAHYYGRYVGNIVPPVPPAKPPAHKNLAPEDAHPSSDGYAVEERGDHVLCAFEVPGYGAVVMRAQRDSAGRWEYHGVSLAHYEKEK